jgi:acyl-CoA synthetase (AMP-forming)/AMP-acid ligase II
MRAMTLATTVPEAARRFGDQAAFVSAVLDDGTGGWALSYADLDRLSAEAAAGLAAAGIGEGDLVCLLLPSTPDYVVAYAALARLGAITAGVNPRFTAPERAAVLDVARPAAVLATPEMASQLGVEAGDHRVLRVLPVERATEAEDILASVRRRPTPAATQVPVLASPDDPERLVAVAFTSGTTGRPKGAMFTNRELVAVTDADVGDRWGGGGHLLAATQLAHVGFMTKLPWYLRLGTTTHLLERWRAGDVLSLIERHRMTSIGGIAPQVALMLRHPDFDRYDLSCVETIIMGGAASPPALVREARQRFGAAYSIRYSSTESGGIGLGTAFDADDDEALHTVGRPRPAVAVSIRDDDGHPVPEGEVGALWLRSPTQMRGYWRDPEATAAALVDGWLRTGDLARLDERGLVHLAGRATEMYIRGGYNVHPAEIEAVLGEHPAVAAVAVVPRPDPVMGEIGVAVVVPSDPVEPPTLETLRAFAADRLAHHKLPEAVRAVAELPLTAMQKVDRRVLVAHEASTASDPGTRS